jgi:hypothetical protein
MPPKKKPVDSIKVESGIPLPPTNSTHQSGVSNTLRTMKIGESFLYRGLPVTVRIIANRISKEAGGRKFATRKVEGGLRVWRIK